MAPPNSLAHKGAEVEEWLDLRFFRPLGLRLAGALRVTAVSADQVTLAGMAVGLIGAGLFYPASSSLNWLGLGLLVFSDILDSADGQLARLRGTSSRWGRILDGISDTVRFAWLYLILAARLTGEGMSPLSAGLLILAGGYSQSVHAKVADFTRQVFLWLQGDKTELDLPEDLPENGRTAWIDRLQFAIYRGYVTGQVRWCRASAALVRQQRLTPTPGLAALWVTSQHRWIGRLVLIGTNIRFPLLALSIVARNPTWFLWATVVPLNLALVWILGGHERQARALAQSGTPSAVRAAGAAG